jgi:hypothetical protein
MVNTKVIEVSSSLAQALSLIQKKRYEQLDALIDMIIPRIKQMVEDDTIFDELLELPTNEANQVYQCFEPLMSFANTTLSILNSVDNNFLLGAEQISEKHNQFIRYAMIYLGRVKEMAELLKVIADDDVVVDENDLSYEDFALNYANMIQKKQKRMIVSPQNFAAHFGI